VGNKFVPNSVNGLQVDRVGRILFDLSPQPGNVVVHSAMTGAFLLRPRCGHELSARDNQFRSGNQKLQHLELLQSQPHPLLRPAEFHFSEIQRNLTELRHVTDFSTLNVCHGQLLPCLGINVVAQQ